MQSVQTVLKDPRKWRRIILYTLGVGVLIGAVAVFGKWIGAHMPAFEAWIHDLGFWGPVVFIAIFILLTLFQLPESLLAIAAGVCFGLWKGFLVLMLANVLGAAAGFWLYRLLLRNRVKTILEKHPKLKAVEEAVSGQGFRLMVLLRLGPFNYTMLNAILGASEVRFRAFMFAIVGAFPGNFATVYFGYVAKHIAMKRAHADNLSTTHEIIAIVGFVVTIVVCLFVGHVARHALKRAEEERKRAESDDPQAVPA